MSPWALGLGVLISFTAVAGQNSASDWNIAPLAAMSRAPGTSEPASFADAATGDFGQTHALIQQARLAIGDPDDIRAIPDEREPHVELKPDVQNFPQVDRTHKGDPVVSMRPGIETRLLTPSTFGLVQPSHLAFTSEGERQGQVKAARMRVRASLTVPPNAFLSEDRPSDAPLLPDTPSTTQKSTAAASPAQTASVATPTAEARREIEKPPERAAPVAANFEDVQQDRALHGATPVVTRAVALGSSTPAQPDAIPIEVSSFKSAATLALATPADANGRPDYAALVNHDKLDREKRCLAEAVYFESRSEPQAGQAAVAQVVLNRVSSGLYPSSVCGVVYQNRHHYHGCQFSFACEGKSLRITERESWEQAVRIANEVMDGQTYIADVGRSTHYHANYVRPRWARALTKMDVIGRHIFYRLKPGQT